MAKRKTSKPEDMPLREDGLTLGDAIRAALKPTKKAAPKKRAKAKGKEKK